VRPRPGCGCASWTTPSGRARPELRIYPSTKGSRSAVPGRRERRYRFDHLRQQRDGLVTALDVAPCDGSGELLHVEGDATLRSSTPTGSPACSPATIRLAPRREWVAVWAAAPDYRTGTDALRALLQLDPERGWLAGRGGRRGRAAPDPALDPARASVRAIVAAPAAATATALLRRAGAEVLDIRAGLVAADRITALSYTTPRSTCRTPPRLLPPEVAGTPLWTTGCGAGRLRRHGAALELMRERPIGMLMAPYVSPERSTRVGRARGDRVSYHSPHN